MRNLAAVYILAITVSCLITTGLNVVHTLLVLKLPLTPITFLIPLIAGILFGLTVGHIYRLSQQMSEIAHTDALTRIYNRLHFNRILDVEIDKVKRYGGVFSVIFFDLDRFKQINDTHGHLQGDHILCEVASVISRANRSADVFARYGGEEFIILTPSTDQQGAVKHAERLRQDIENHHFTPGLNITCSFGVAEFDTSQDNHESIVKRADQALYLAKENGRNRVETLPAFADNHAS